MENADLNNISIEDAENIFSQLSEKVANEIQSDEKTNQIKEILESFRDYLNVVITSVNQNKYNESMVKELCKMITKYYEDLDSDVESDSSSESSADSDDDSQRYVSVAKQLGKINESDAETSDSDNDSTVANFIEDDKEEKRPPKLVSITNENEVDSDEDMPVLPKNNPKNLFTSYIPLKPSTPPPKKVDNYFEDFMNGMCDVNKRITKFDYNVTERLSNYTRKVYSY